MTAQGNIILIGMPGSGKTTVGRIVAERLSYEFLDTDDAIVGEARKSLPELLAEHGEDGFLQLESRVVQGLVCRAAVIATGGSVVLALPAMEHLRHLGTIVYLSVPLPALARRLADAATRGIVGYPRMSLAAIYESRVPLYKQFADITVLWEQDDASDCAEAVLAMLNKKSPDDGLASR